MRFKVWFWALDRGSRVGVLVLAIAFSMWLVLGLLTVPLVALSAAFLPVSQPLGLVDAPDEPSPEVETPPVATSDEVTESIELPFHAVTVSDPTLAEGTTTITTIGIPGTLERVYRVTYLDGVETGRELVSETTVLAPVDEVTSIGTYVAPPPVVSNCDSNYADGCVPIASDVDCAGGSGNGPAYVSGVVRVVGRDIYDLDRDGNGYGCD